MTHYLFSFSNPHRHFLNIDLTIDVKGLEEVFFQLPAWRPGRYELANFARNIQKWEAFNHLGERLPHFKMNKDRWRVITLGADKITISYNYYANELNAGSTFLDEKQLYVNPVNCCIYMEGRLDEECIVDVNVPKDYKLACSLNKYSEHCLRASSFDELAESPFIASNTLKHDFYEAQGVLFHLWFQGASTPPFDKLKKDFKSFTEEQINCFGSFPSLNYHFLFQITPYNSYHGVEHTNSTVILLGSEQDVFQERYDDLLGISSHELYHTWNIKSIRPTEMFPYDYTKENYSRLGYVSEGVTTYMGDLMLYRSGVFNWKQFSETQNLNLKRHLENGGRHNLSVADSSFDTWLDGYELGIPNRKTSIYTEGALCMFMLDVLIIKNSNGQASLHDVMKILYIDYALKGKGYTEDDFKRICVDLGGRNVLNIFNNHIYGVQDYIPSLDYILNIIDLNLVDCDNPSKTANMFGFITIQSSGKTIVKRVLEDSVSDAVGISVDDEILAVNKRHIDQSIDNLLDLDMESVVLKVKSRFETKDLTLQVGKYYALKKIKKASITNSKANFFREVWSKN